MAKQIILHYPGSYVERPHTIVFDSQEDYQEFLEKKSYRLKPNVMYGVFVLGATVSTEFMNNKLVITPINPDDTSLNFPEIEVPEIDIKVPETKDDIDVPTNPKKDDIKEPDDDNEVIIINPGTDKEEDSKEEQEDKKDTKGEDEIIIITPDEQEKTETSDEDDVVVFE